MTTVLDSNNVDKIDDDNASVNSINIGAMNLIDVFASERSIFKARNIDFNREDSDRVTFHYAGEVQEIGVENSFHFLKFIESKKLHIIGNERVLLELDDVTFSWGHKFDGITIGIPLNIGDEITSKLTTYYRLEGQEKPTAVHLDEFLNTFNEQRILDALVNLESIALFTKHFFNNQPDNSEMCKKVLVGEKVVNDLNSEAIETAANNPMDGSHHLSTEL